MDSTQLQELIEARDELIDRLIESNIDGSGVDKVMALINAVDDVTAAFDLDVSS